MTRKRHSWRRLRTRLTAAWLRSRNVRKATVRPAAATAYRYEITGIIVTEVTRLMKLIRPKYVVALSAAVALTVSAGASLAASGAASKTGGPQNAAQRCKEQRKAMGKKAFRELYGVGSKHRAAFSRCVAKLKQEDTQDAKNAAQECRAERQQMGDEAFANKYGTNANKRNAFGKCVSQKAREEAEEDQEATITAAKECKAERAKDRTAFAEKYGTNKNKRNAFGKCVSQKASAHDDDE